MGRYILTALAMFLVICAISQSLKASNSTFEIALLELCNAHYLFAEIALDTSQPNQSSVWLSAKVWNNPKDTRKLVDSIKSLVETLGAKDYSISVFGKPSLSNRIALIKARPKGVELDYTYIVAKQNSSAFKKPSWENVDVLNVRGRKIHKGLPADSVFQVLSKLDAIAASDVSKDEAGSLIVTHHWKVDNKFIDITFERWDNMYRVRVIRVLFDNQSLNGRKKDKAQKKAAMKPKSCHIYEDCTMYGGCKSFSNCYDACLDDCKRSGCSLCK